MSVPRSGLLVRAVIPVFGTVYDPTGKDPIKIWYLEYGPGRYPSHWTRIKESQTPYPSDPYASGKIVWDPNWGAHGNLTDWNVGLQGYRYAQWKNNLNGIYTLRLVAESVSGEVSETRATVYVGEAIVRTQGGTAISPDGGCRVSVQSFSFDDRDARVVTVIRQIPSFESAPTLSAGATDEVGGTADPIYRTLDPDFQRVSAIYRVFPNGLKVDPALTIQIDSPLMLTPAEQESTGIFQWNPVVKRWSPLPTEWAGRTAQAKTYQLAEYACYVAVLRRKPKGGIPAEITWQPTGALQGYWTGFSEPSSIVRISLRGQTPREARADENGAFTLPFLLSPSTDSYAVEILSADGTDTLGKFIQRQATGSMVMPRAPRLSAPLSSELSDTSPLYLVCEDDSLADPAVTKARSIAVSAHNSNFSKSLTFELAESVPGSGRFLAEINARDSQSPYCAALKELKPGESLTLTAGSSILHLTITRSTPPEVRLSSPTHPSLFYASGNTPSPTALLGTRNHSPASIEWIGEGWKLAGTDGKPSARIIHWANQSINVESWPLIGFSYRSMDAQNWQLLLRSENSIHTLNLGKADSWFRDFSKTAPLENRNEWMRWQQNLTGGPLKMIDEVSFGSWVKGAFLEARPAFRDMQSETLWIKDLWIGRTYNEAAVQMDWNIKETAPLSSIEWWVNQSPESREPAPQDIKARIEAHPKTADSCRFTVPESGTWYFHLRATDTAGFANPPTAFPLSIAFSRQGSRLDALTGVSKEIRWDQPDGAFQIALGDLAQTLSIKTLRLIIGNHEYPMSKATIDYNTASLKVSAESFDATVPLGINGESITATLAGNDLNGRPLDQIAQVDLVIRSPFLEENSTKGLIINVANKESDKGRSWFTYWKSLHAPWMADFPGSVSNSLIFFRGVDSKNERPPIRWERPISIVASTEQKKTWIESMESTWSRQGDALNTKGLPQVDHRGGEIRNSTLNAQWIETITPETPFEPGYVRVGIATKGSGLRLIRTTIKDAVTLLRRQTDKQTLRLDGWIPPSGAPIVVVLPSSASVDYAIGGMTSLNRLSTNTLRLDPSGEWQRFAVLLRAPAKTVTDQTIRIQGTPFW